MAAHDDSNGIRLHERTLLVQGLGAKMGMKFFAFEELAELTPIEAALIVQGWSERLMAHALRYERHGNYEQKVDEA